jgi:hypothetical protein
VINTLSSNALQLLKFGSSHVGIAISVLGLLLWAVGRRGPLAHTS